MSTEQLANLLVSTVELDQCASLYFSIHTKIRQIVYFKLCLMETMDRDRPYILSLIERTYYPKLVREFARWERDNGRAIPKEEVRSRLLENQELRAATSQLLLRWQEEEPSVLFIENKQSRFKRLAGY